MISTNMTSGNLTQSIAFEDSGFIVYSFTVAKIILKIGIDLFYCKKELSYICIMKLSSLVRRSSTFMYAHVHIKPSEQIGMHQQPTWELSYVVSGQGVRKIGDTNEDFYSGEVVLVVPEMEHQWKFDSTKTDSKGMIENYTIVFHSDLLEQVSLFFPEFQEVSQRLMELKKLGSVKFQSGTAERIISILVDMNNQSEAERLASLLLILVCISESNDSQIVGRFVTPTLIEDRLKEIDVYISCNYKREITIEQMASHVGMNRTSFCSFFKKQKGMTFITYLNSFRMDMACYLLRNHELSVSDVCYQAGYKDVPYFTRLFKRIHGKNPTEYRKQYL